MTLSYPGRLLCLSAAVFFLLNLALSAVVALVSPLAIRLAERCRPRRAAPFLLALRLLPGLMAAIVVLAVCVPSYLWLEPGVGAESVGAPCLGAALMGAAVWMVALARVREAVVRSSHFARSKAVHVALAGILRPRLILSPVVADALTPEELAAVLAHERAHWHSRDNLKRLLLLLAPAPLPFDAGFERLERAWARTAEWAADDDAVAGNQRRSLSLAAALVRVARLQTQPAPPLAASLLGEPRDFAARVARLLLQSPAPQLPERRIPVVRGGMFVALAAVFAAVVLHPATLFTAHQLLERLME